MVFGLEHFVRGLQGDAVGATPPIDSTSPGRTAVAAVAVLHRI